MICENCKLVNLCKNYDFFRQHPEITYYECSNYETNRKNNVIPINKFVQTTPVDIPAKENKDEIITCPSCGAETLKSDLDKCSSCNTVICSSCGTSLLDISSGNIKACCEKCYNNEISNNETGVDE